MPSSVYRDGSFDRIDIEMTGCAGAILSRRHPELVLSTDVTPSGAVSISAKSGYFGPVIWTIVAKSTGPESAHVQLLNNGAAPNDLLEAWQAIESCGQL
jgi:hypothetical protein